MNGLAVTLITLGGLMLVGLVTDVLGRRTPLPRVTLLLIFGFAIGPSGMHLLHGVERTWFPLIAHMALVMVGFLLGESLTLGRLREHGRQVVGIAAAVGVATAALIAAGLILLGTPWDVALLLAGIGPATAPAATADVIREAHARGPLSQTLLGVVAVDDAWGLLLFSLSLAAITTTRGEPGAAVALWCLQEIGGALGLGLALGVPMAYLTGRLQPGEPTREEALGMVFLCGGLALWLEVSFLLAAMTMGAVVANLARHHTRPFHAIERIEHPFLVLFFVLAGASLHLDALATVGTIGAGYIGLRILGRLIGANLGARWSGAPPQVQRWIWLALMPQAGVALGMALIAAQRFPELGRTVLPVVIGGTVVFELLGPPLTRLALTRAGERRLS